MELALIRNVEPFPFMAIAVRPAFLRDLARSGFHLIKEYSRAGIENELRYGLLGIDHSFLHKPPEIGTKARSQEPGAYAED